MNNSEIFQTYHIKFLSFFLGSNLINLGIKYKARECCCYVPAYYTILDLLLNAKMC